MRWPWVIVVAGCGRFGFDADTDARSAGDALEPSPGCVGADEDADGWPDACDNCLTDPNPSQADVGEVDAGLTADGVGDACDPRPTLAGDHVAFAALHDGDALALYDSEFGSVSMPGNSSLRLGSLIDSGSAVFVFSGDVTRVDCRMTVVDASNQLQWFGVWTDDSIVESLFLEGAWQAGNPNGVFRIKEDLAGSAERYSTDILGPTRFTAGAKFRVVSDTELVTGTQQRMTVTDRITGISGSVSLTIQIPRVGQGYLEANNMIVDFESLVIYSVR